ncbi:hypothetical protein K3G39_03340 [Pontibacter sp. HSC-14F20]|uniref:hypothetical protein n=1 Tax=Pontibacter sp. HSC-14F20 TaxID=2864136 RepID=UPI001C72AF1E|nr:hypothetical protein [Pontibacter sp. HSC-14F20]MBX0332261.1 hypothetical protein [Pontibacter sp. HSC-14F20]
MNRLSLISKIQGVYWAVTGIWPLVHMPSFIWVTGPKDDLWLVRTVGVLISVIGLVLLAAGIKKRITPEIRWLGIGSAAGLGFVDVYYSLNDVIRNVYLLDAVGELILILLWLWAGQRGLVTSTSKHSSQQH